MNWYGVYIQWTGLRSTAQLTESHSSEVETVCVAVDGGEINRLARLLVGQLPAPATVGKIARFDVGRAADI